MYEMYLALLDAYYMQMPLVLSHLNHKNTLLFKLNKFFSFVLLKPFIQTVHFLLSSVIFIMAKYKFAQILPSW